MRLYLALACLLAFPALALGAAPAPLDPARYMPLSELRPGMTGVGKTTLQGTDIVEFQFKVMAIVRNVGPKRDLIVVRCSGAGLEESGVVAGMSGSPTYIDGRLVGAVAYSFPWCKIPLAGIQPIEQMHRVTDEHPWAAPPAAGKTASGLMVSPDLLGAADVQAVRESEITVPAAALAGEGLPQAMAGRDSYQMRPILTPVMVSGVSGRALDRFREDLAPMGLVPMQAGAADAEAVAKAKLEPGAPLAVSLVRGDVRATTMGTITEIIGDRLYAFGHPMLGMGETDLPMLTGVAHVVVPSLQNSFRLGAPARDIGRLVWDEETAVLGRLGKAGAPLIPVTVKLTGPGKTPDLVFRSEMVNHRNFSPMLAAMVAGNSITALTDLPREHTVVYRVTVKPVGRDPIVRENVAVSPNADNHVATQVRNLVGLLMENPFQNLAVESVDVEARVEPVARTAEIEEVRVRRNAVRPGQSVPVEVKIRPLRMEPEWLKIEVPVPADYPDGSCHVALCGADEAMRAEMREAPARFRSEDIEGLLRVLRRNEPREQLYVRLEAPGEGLSVGTDELPNLPATMRAVLGGSAGGRISGIRQPTVTKRPMPYVIIGAGEVEFTINRRAPEP